MTDEIDSLYQIALDSEISVGEFWNSSLAEIFDAIESYNRREKSKIQLLFVEAEVIANRLSFLMDHKTPLLMPWDYYPAVFAEEKAIKDKEELENFKARRRDAMDAHNAMRHRQEVNKNE